MKPKLLDKKKGYLSASDLIESEPLLLTISSVEPGKKHPDLDEPNLVIKFDEIEDAFHVNYRTEQELRETWGRNWSGNKIKIDVVRTFLRGYLVYGLRATPL